MLDSSGVSFQSDSAGTTKISLLSGVVLKTLADEELGSVLQYLDLTERWRSSRVCKRWKYIFHCRVGVQHLRIKDYSHPFSLLAAEFYTDSVFQYEIPTANWRHQSSSVRTLVINYGFGIDLAEKDISFKFHCRTQKLIHTLAKWLCPDLHYLHVVNYVDLNPGSFKWFARGLEHVQTRLRQWAHISITGGEPFSNTTGVHGHGNMCGNGLDTSGFGALVYPCGRPHRLFEVEHGYWSALSDYLWPDGSNANVWLAKNAHVLNNYPELVRVLARAMRSRRGMVANYHVNNTVCFAAIWMSTSIRLLVNTGAVCCAFAFYAVLQTWLHRRRMTFWTDLSFGKVSTDLSEGAKDMSLHRLVRA